MSITPGDLGKSRLLNPLLIQQNMHAAMAHDSNDIRTYVDLNQEVSPWFWEVVALGQQNRESLTRIMEQYTREDLIRFQTEFEKTASYFHCPPFCEDHMSSSTAVDEGALWVVSQGKQYVIRIWADPLLFSGVLQNWSDDMVDSSYESIAVNVYLSRFGEEMPTLKYDF